MNVPKPLSNNTPVTLALALMLGSGLFSVGYTMASNDHRIDAVCAKQERFEKETTEWRTEIQKLLNKMTEVSSDNKRRLDIADAVRNQK